MGCIGFGLAHYAELLAGGLAASSVRTLHVVLRSSLGAAVRLGLVSRNVAAQVRPPRLARSELRVWSAEEARAFLAWVQAHKPERYVLYAVALATGMRQGELLALRWRDVDLRAGVLHVAGQLTRQRDADGSLIVGEPKTEKGRRRIVIDERLVSLLKLHRVEQHAHRLKLGPAWVERDLVFCGEDGDFRSGQSLLQHFNHDVRFACAPRIRFHDLRHTAATLALAAGMDTLSISEMLGHSSVVVTLQRYGHVQPEMQKRLAEVLGSCLFG